MSTPSFVVRVAAVMLGLCAFIAPSAVAQTTAASSSPWASTAPAGAVVTAEGWWMPPKPASDVPPRPDHPKKVFIVPIREEISSKTYETLRRKAVQIRAAGADLVIFDMDTYGGRIDAMERIINLIQWDLGRIHTVCFIRNKAESAGSMIAMACNEIVMISGSGTMGSSAPVVPGTELGAVEREKAESFLRSVARGMAERNGYEPALAQKMISQGIEVWLVRHKTTRELKYVLKDEWLAKVDVPPHVRMRPQTAEPRSPKPAEAPAPTFAPDPSLPWELVEIVSPEGRLLNVTSAEAVRFRFVRDVVPIASPEAPYAGILQRMHVGSVQVLSDTWSEKLVEFLTSPAVTGLLILGLIIFTYIEFHAGAFGIVGGLAIACLAILLGSRFLIGMAQWWEVAIMVVGFILIGLEIFVIPGFGVAGILGGIMVLVGLVAILIPNAPGRLPLPTSPLDWRVLQLGLIAVAAGTLAATIAAMLLAAYLPKVPLANRLMLAPVQASADASITEDTPLRRLQPGDMGVVEAICRPVGKARFGDHLLDAVSEGGIIESGASVRVLRREGNRLVVERA